MINEYCLSIKTYFQIQWISIDYIEISLLLKWSQPRVCPSLVLHEWSQMDPSPMMGTGDSIHVPSWVDLQRIITTTIFHQTKEKPSNDLTRTWNRYGMDYLWVYQKNTLFCIVVFIFRKEAESPHTRVVLQEPPHIKRLLPSSPKASLSELVEQGLLVGRLCLENSQISQSLLEMRRSKKQTLARSVLFFVRFILSWRNFSQSCK